MFLQKNRRRKKLPVEKNRSTFLYDRRLSLRKSSTGRFFDYFSLRALRAPLSPLLTAPMYTSPLDDIGILDIGLMIQETIISLLI